MGQFDLKKYAEEANKIWNFRYDYVGTKRNEKNGKLVVGIVCHEKDGNGEEHGEFDMIPSNTLNPYLHTGCPKCGRRKCDESRKLTFEEFVEKANKRHGYAYIYYNDEIFKNRKKGTKLKITCPIHGDFEQTLTNHLFGQGCPICKTSKLEQEIANFLTENKVEYVHEKTFDWLGSKRLDFYLPKYNIGIECQGIQHFIDDHFYEPLEITQKRDKIKKQLCDKNGIKLLYYSNLGIDYPYDVFENKEELLKEIIK